MGSIRINELARELEVKSRAILNCLEKIGITEKKSHSSSLDQEWADKVRAYFRGERGPSEPAPPKPAQAAPAEPAEPDPRPSKIEAPAATAPKPPAKSPEPPMARQSFTRSIAEIKAAARKTVVPHPPAHPVAAQAAPSPQSASPEQAKPMPAGAILPGRGVPVRPGSSQPVAKVAEVVATKPKSASSPIARIPGKGTEAAAPAAQAPSGKAARPSKLPPSKQPIYPTAGLPKAVPTRTHSHRRPGDPRPMHPTARPATGAAGAGRASGRKKIVVPKMDRRSAAPAQPATPEEVQITRTITITEGVSIKELSEKLEVRAKDVLKRLLEKGIFATINQTLD
ncbi:MAG TPA: translation initiation factor IF-2 N-terminal domain-containing protein, partial [Terriglobia bacterium]|nr:translation initiation factor IF-2 N-terminal domain-containing protein [Terriglobia bacterium]